MPVCTHTKSHYQLYCSAELYAERLHTTKDLCCPKSSLPREKNTSAVCVASFPFLSPSLLLILPTIAANNRRRKTFFATSKLICDHQKISSLVFTWRSGLQELPPIRVHIKMARKHFLLLSALGCLNMGDTFSLSPACLRPAMHHMRSHIDTRINMCEKSEPEIRAGEMTERNRANENANRKRLGKTC